MLLKVVILENLFVRITNVLLICSTFLDRELLYNILVCIWIISIDLLAYTRHAQKVDSSFWKSTINGGENILSQSFKL
jgi:hypothetical protein